MRQFAAELVYFSDCILDDHDPEPSGWEGLADVRIAEAIYRSTRSGKMIELPPFSDKRRPTLRQEIHRPPHGKPKVINTASPSGEVA